MPVPLLKLDCCILYINLHSGLPYHRVSLAMMKASNYTIYWGGGGGLAKCHAFSPIQALHETLISIIKKDINTHYIIH